MCRVGTICVKVLNFLTINKQENIMSTNVSLRPSNRRFRIGLRRVGRLAYWTGQITRDEWKQIREVVWNPTRTTDDGEEVNLIDEVMEETKMQLLA